MSPEEASAAAAQQRAIDICTLCHLADRSTLVAKEFIASTKTLAEIRSELVMMRAVTTGGYINSHHRTVN